MNAAIILPILISFAISAALGPVVIPLLRRLKFGQTERDDGPKSHLKKTGTPTMGGLMILAGVILTSLIYVKDYPRIVPVLFVTAGFGIIGFLDDYIKIMLHRSEGLTPPQKMLGQFLVTGIFVFYTYGGDQNPVIYSMVYNSFVFVDIAIALAVAMVMFASRSFRAQINKSSGIYEQDAEYSAANGNQ